MGVDIYMFIVKNKTIIKNNIYTGRNSEWFDNISDRIHTNIYNDFPTIYGWSPATPEILKTRYSRKKGYYDFYHFKVKYFIEWFERFKPDTDAGWVTTYEKWLYETKGIIPNYLHHQLSDVSDEVWFCEKDWQFIEVKNNYDCSRWLYDYLIDNKIDPNADVTYCFNC